MSNSLLVIRRYAKALYEAARDRSLIDQVMNEMKGASAVFEGNPDLRVFLQLPNIDPSVKKNLLTEMFKDNLSDITLNLLLLLIERKRSAIVSQVYEYYIKEVDAALDRAQAVVYSPELLTEQEESAIRNSFGKLTGKSIRITNVVDESLLGGIKVLVGDKLYDGSVSGKLSRLKKAFLTPQAL